MFQQLEPIIWLLLQRLLLILHPLTIIREPILFYLQYLQLLKSKEF